MLFQDRAVFVVPAGAGEYAPERITILRPQQIYGLTTLIEAGPASAVYELWLLRAGGDPSNDDPDTTDDFAKWKTSTGGETWPLAGWYGAQIRVKSDGNAGNATVSVTAV